MSTSIYGWIEIYLPTISEWAAITKISLLADQNYNAYGCLFGVRNYSNFLPIAEKRGIPSDASDLVKEETANPEHYSDPSWVSYKEVEAINWNESVVDAYVRVYEKLENGDFATSSSNGYIPNKPLTRQVGDNWQVSGKDAMRFKNGELHKIERITRREALRAFQAVFDIMKILADRNGSENVRLVVWFA